jgi:hypothetical protein
MIPTVSILTPSVPERADMLAECAASISSQLFHGFEHLIEIDTAREGCSKVINRLAARAQGDWLLPLADDDLLLPGGLSSLLAHAVDADVVYSPPLVTGNEDRWWFFQAPPAIPSTALIRTSLWRKLGGYDETLRREEDRDMWIKAVSQDARFVRVDHPCWVYRQHSGNKSFQVAA